MADRDLKPPSNRAQFDPHAERKRVIRQRNIVLGLVLAFFVVLFFAITVVKMKHVKLPHRSAGAPALVPLMSAAGATNGH